MKTGVILYGPPASGKNTVTNALHRLRGDCFAFPRIKVGGASKPEYRMLSEAAYSELESQGEILWSNHRYGATYAIDGQGLLDALERGVPVIHLGQVEPALFLAAMADVHWVTVELWCDRDLARQRLEDRGAVDLVDRMAAWDATERLDHADVLIDTGITEPPDAAALILSSIARAVPPVPPVPESL